MNEKMDPNDIEIGDAIPKNYYELNKWYAISINPDNSKQSFNTLDRYTNFRKKYYRIINPMQYDDINYRMYIEISEPRGAITTGGPRLHLHGRILFKSNKGMLKFLIDYLPSMLQSARVDIDTIDDILVWDAYCTKQQCVWEGTNYPFKPVSVTTVKQDGAE